MNEQQKIPGAVDVEDTTHRAVLAALAVIDADIAGAKKSIGPLGDHLAGKLDAAIRSAIEQHLEEVVS